MADVEWSDDEEEEPAYAQGLTKITALWQPKPKAATKAGRPVSYLGTFPKLNPAPSISSPTPPHPAPRTPQAKKARLGPFKERELHLVESF